MSACLRACGSVTRAWPAAVAGAFSRISSSFWADVPVVSAARPAAEGSAWVIGAPLDERGAGLAEELGSSPGPPGREDTRGS
jgi:hypothetical protein